MGIWFFSGAPYSFAGNRLIGFFMKKTSWHIVIEIILVAVIVTLVIYIRNSSPQQIQSESQPTNTVSHAVSQTDPALPSDYSSLMKYIDATADTPAIAKAVVVLRGNTEFRKKAITEFSLRAEKTDGQERLKCVWVLGEFQDNDALKTLSSLLNSDDKSLKMFAYSAIERTGTAEAIGVLFEKYSGETDDFMKEAALQNILRIDKEKALPLLIKQLRSDKYEASVQILKRISGQSFDAESRGLTIKEWENWLAQNHRKPD